MKTRVLFLYNGGTIGLVPEMQGDKLVRVPPKDASVFKDACEPVLKYFRKDFDIDFEIVTTADSTNLTPNDWEKLIYRVKKAQDEENYDAVGIVHGTDTLAYSATALALALHGRNPEETGLRIPVCLTGAQTPIYELGGDGRFNLENLFRVIKVAIDEGVADVLVNFWDTVLLGCRTVKISEKFFGAFNSPAYSKVGSIDATGAHITTNLVRKKKDAKNTMSIAPKFGRGVLSFELTPGIDPSLIMGFVSNGGIAAMIFKSLGEGHVCTEGEFNLIPTIKKTTHEYKTPIFITTKFTFMGGSAVSTHYEVGVKGIEAGGIPCYDHTDVAVDVKVRWLIGNGICAGIEDFTKAMKTSYAGEVTPP